MIGQDIRTIIYIPYSQKISPREDFSFFFTQLYSHGQIFIPLIFLELMQFNGNFTVIELTFNNIIATGTYICFYMEQAWYCTCTTYTPTVPLLEGQS